MRLARKRQSIAALLWGTLAALALMGGGCRADRRLANCGGDQAQLSAALIPDVRAEKHLSQADRLATEGQGKKAADLVERQTLPKVTEALETASRITPQSRWGQEQKIALVGLLSDRQKALQSYVLALRSEDLEKIVAEMEQQKAVERRALELTEKLHQTPGPDSPACDRP